MSSNQDQGAGVAGYFEPELHHTFLPGCRNCRGAHPLARKPVPVNTEDCPDCGHAVEQPGVTRVERATLTGSTAEGLVARACLSIGKALTKLSKRI